MLLVIDIGNTNITCGIFDKDNLIHKSNFVSENKDLEFHFTKIKQQYNITDCIVASVVKELDLLVKKICDTVFGCNTMLFNSQMKTGVKLKVQNANTVGVDRIANTYAAWLIYKTAVIVVDSGSAITFDIVSSSANFIGGVIMPGIKMQLETLNLKTSQLPNLDITESYNAIGNCTQNAILSGVLRGSSGAVENLIEQCKQELEEKTLVVATGGGCNLTEKYMNKKFDIINPDLTLLGLKSLYELNKQT